MSNQEALDKIAETLERLGEPLTESQKLGMHGTLAVLLEKARLSGVRHAESMYEHCRRTGVNWP